MESSLKLIQIVMQDQMNKQFKYTMLIQQSDERSTLTNGDQTSTLVMTTTTEDGKQGEFKVYPQRWLVLIAFSSFAFVASLPFIQYAPILNVMMDYYGVDTEHMLWLTNIFYLGYIIVSIPMINPIQKYLGPMVIAAAFFEFVGLLLIYLFPRDFWMCVCAYVLFAFWAVVQMNSPVAISEKWFPPEERTFATSVGCLVQYLGLNYGFMLPAIYLRNDDKQTQEETFDQITFIAFTHACVSGFTFLLCAAFVRTEPPTPPSKSAQSSRAKVIPSFIALLKVPSNIIDLISMAIFSGISWCFISAITVILTPHGYSQTQIGAVGLSYQIVGTMGGFLVSFLIDRQIAEQKIPSYDFWLRLLLIISYSGTIAYAICVQIDDLILCCALTAIVGFGLNAYLPIGIQSMIEKNYPNDDLAITTGIFIFAEGFGFLTSQLVNLGSFEEYGLWVIVAMMTPFMVYVLFFYKTQLKRLNHVHEAEQKYE